MTDDISFDVDAFEEQKAKQRRWKREWRQRRYIRLKETFIKDLGGECIQCHSTLDLEFHHPNGRDWSPNRIGRIQRIKRYIAEWEVDHKSVELLCKTCNTSDGGKRKGS